MSQKKNGKKKYLIAKNSLTPKINGAVSLPLCMKETPLYTSLPGYYMVEAAVTIPVFVCFAVCILFFFCMMQLQLEIQASLNYTGKVLAEYAVLENTHPEQVNEQTEFAAAEVMFRKHLMEQEPHTEYIEYGMAGIRLSESTFDGEYIQIKASYRIKLPIGIFGKHVFEVNQLAKTRKWTGDCGVGADGDVVDEWVYITPTGTAYHSTSQCSYLKLSIQSVAYIQLEQLRNQSGGRYDACRSCGKNAGVKVYITDYGDAYHSDISCSGLKRSIQKVKKEEAGGRHACKKCGG